MTATASKAGLRATATAKRTKAAQRTPLPAKNHAENVRLAREAVEESKPAKAKPGKPGPKPVPPITKPAKAAPKEEAPQDKAARYAGELSALGWKPEVTRTDGKAELVATRGGTEALYLSWFNGAHISGESTYTYADRTTKVRNPAEAMRVAARQPEEAKASQARVAANRSFVKRATGPSVRHVPFDVTEATDQEVMDAIRGHRITWHNQYRVESETAIVGNIIRVDRHRGGHRIVSFVDPETGYRAFKLENLENVGARVNLERIKQEILASLTREAKRQERKAA